MLPLFVLLPLLLLLLPPPPPGFPFPPSMLFPGPPGLLLCAGEMPPGPTRPPGPGPGPGPGPPGMWPPWPVGPLPSGLCSGGGPICPLFIGGCGGCCC